MILAPAELHDTCSSLYEKVAADLKNTKIGSLPGEYDAFLLAEFAHSLIDNIEILLDERNQAIKEREQAFKALKQAKKTLKAALKTVKGKETSK
jgi:hypothetical protein